MFLFRGRSYSKDTLVVGFFDEGNDMNQDKIFVVKKCSTIVTLLGSVVVDNDCDAGPLGRMKTRVAALAISGKLSNRALEHRRVGINNASKSAEARNGPTFNSPLTVTNGNRRLGMQMGCDGGCSGISVSE